MFPRNSTQYMSYEKYKDVTPKFLKITSLKKTPTRIKMALQ